MHVPRASALQCLRSPGDLNQIGAYGVVALPHQVDAFDGTRLIDEYQEKLKEAEILFKQRSR
jgi:hypothetical protein